MLGQTELERRVSPLSISLLLPWVGEKLRPVALVGCGFRRALHLLNHESCLLAATVSTFDSSSLFCSACTVADQMMPSSGLGVTCSASASFLLVTLAALSSSRALRVLPLK